MNAAIARLKNHFVNWREWEINPIVIKELRQGVRSWTVTGMLILFLVVLFIASLGFLISESIEINQGLGASMFGAFAVILAGASIFFIPLYIGIRVASERQENNPDLLYVTTLSPARIIFGKFLCGAYIAVLFFSACMPFMAFTNFLRGVDLPTVFFILFFLFLIVCTINMIAIFLACLPVSRPFKILFVLATFAGSFSLVMPLGRIVTELMRSGVGAMMTDKNFWIGTFTIGALVAAICGLFFVLAAALISPPSANRALPVRLYLTIFWLVSGLLATFWAVRTHDADRLLPWSYLFLPTMIMALLVVISNSDTFSVRVRRVIPVSRLQRFLAFFFYNGAAGGLLWVAAIMMTTFLLSNFMFSFYSGGGFTDDAQRTYLTFMLYAFDYALTALFLHRKFFPRRPPKLTGLLAILLPAGWALVPNIFLFFVNRLTWTSFEGLQVGNIFNLFVTRDNTQVFYHEFFAGGWLLIVTLLNVKWFNQQIKYFQPLVKTNAVVVPDETPAVTPTGGLIIPPAANE